MVVFNKKALKYFIYIHDLLTNCEHASLLDENKYKVYNFYGISGNFDKDNERYGVFDFKKGFNATVDELIGEFDLPISKFWYFLYTQAFKIYRNLKKVNPSD